MQSTQLIITVDIQTYCIFCSYISSYNLNNQEQHKINHHLADGEQVVSNQH